MAEEFAAIPAELARVSGFVHDIGSQEAAVAAQMNAEPTGNCFSTHGDCQPHWTRFHENVDAVNAQVAWLINNADFLRQAAGIFQASDEV